MTLYRDQSKSCSQIPFQLNCRDPAILCHPATSSLQTHSYGTVSHICILLGLVTAQSDIKHFKYERPLGTAPPVVQQLVVH